MDITQPNSTHQNVDQNQNIKRFIVRSLIAHVTILMVLFIKQVVFPSSPEVYLPSLRVDLVALPDRKMTETQVLPVAPKPEESAPPKVEEKKVEEKKVKIETKSEDEGDYAIHKKKKHEKSVKEKTAQKKLKNALARIKALERIKAMETETVKGNQISKGSSLSGEAKVALETTYFDVILEQVRSNWELPKWLQEQNLSAKAQVFIDRHGNLSRYEIVKSSGNEQFDNEVKRTLQAAAPFPVPPNDIASEMFNNGVVLGFPL